MRPSPRILLAQAGSPALLLADLTNIRYLTGRTLSTGLVLVLPRSYTLYVDARYAEEARSGGLLDVRVRPLDRLKDDLARHPACGFEEDVVTVARLARWKKAYPQTKFTPAGRAVEEFRRCKDASELKAIRRAQRVTTELMRRVPAALRMGITERALAWELEIWARELGADGMAFPSIVGFGAHTSRPHHLPTTRALRKGDIVQIDAGAVVDGYCADMSRVYFTAAPTAEQEAALRAVNAAKDAAMNAARPGVTGAELDAIARDTLRAHGVRKHAYPHALGHGVGLEVHEGPTLSFAAAPKPLLEGEVLAIEPAVYVPGKFGIRVEDMVVITAH